MSDSNSRKIYLTRACLVAGLALSWACAQLPDDFEQQSIEGQIDAYVKFLESGGLSGNLRAIDSLASKGKPAAQAMVPFILRQENGIDLLDALKIITEVQLRGCSLAGSDIESALRNISTQDLGAAERITLTSALDSIEHDMRSPQPRGARVGPCD